MAAMLKITEAYFRELKSRFSKRVHQSGPALAVARKCSPVTTTMLSRVRSFFGLVLKRHGRD
jgi:hypothetical protein